MTVSVGTIAQQALRRLGVRIVPLDDSPTLTEMVPAEEIATAALIELGVINADTGRVPTQTVPTTQIVTTALIELGVLNSDDVPSAEPTIPVDDIAGAALQELGVIASDETPSTSDLTLATEKAVFVHQGLEARGMTRWNNAAIPSAVGEEYIKLTASALASSFGKTADPAIVAFLEGRVRNVATVLTMVPVMMGHLTDAHESLVARGVARWNINAIPAAFAEEYHKLTVAWANISFGRPEMDPALVAGFEERIRAGAAVMTADLPYMLDKLSSVHAALDAQGVVWWDGTAMPRAFAEEYVKLTAAMAANVFGKQIDPKMVMLLEGRIRKGAMVLSSDDIANQHVQAVHDDLAMRGLAQWSSFDIPDAVGDAYSWLAANRMAPLFETQVNPADVRAAEVAIYRYTALPSSGETTPAVYF